MRKSRRHANLRPQRHPEGTRHAALFGAGGFGANRPRVRVVRRASGAPGPRGRLALGRARYVRVRVWGGDHARRPPWERRPRHLEVDAGVEQHLGLTLAGTPSNVSPFGPTAERKCRLAVAPTGLPLCPSQPRQSASPLASKPYFLTAAAPKPNAEGHERRCPDRRSPLRKRWRATPPGPLPPRARVKSPWRPARDAGARRSDRPGTVPDVRDGASSRGAPPRFCARAGRPRAGRDTRPKRPGGIAHVQRNARPIGSR